MNKLLCIQFRTDQSGPHEQRCIKRHTPDVEIDFMSAQNEPLDPSILSSGYGALVIGGLGEADLTEQTQMIQKVVANTRPIVELAIKSDFPTLGVCFGHQLIAHIAGGKVVNDPEYAETGVHDIELTPEGSADSIYQGIPITFKAVVGHKDTVIQLPNSAVELAKNAFAPNHSFRISKNVYGVQYHGELDEKDLVERLKMYPEYLKNVKDSHYEKTPYGPYVLRNFVKNYIRN